jgi:hypothetical protein
MIYSCSIFMQVSIDPPVAETDTGKPLYKASKGD